MKTLNFTKYSAIGNDFILIDNRFNAVTVLNSFNPWVAYLCDRRRGIGADGLLLLENSNSTPFKMRYLNADGQEVSMCGNGARAILHFAKELGINANRFETMDGIYFGQVLASNLVQLKMDHIRDISLINLDTFTAFERRFFLNTGVPHVVLQLKEGDSLDNFDVLAHGKKIRHAPIFSDGTNVNFVERMKGLANDVKIRTFERGVEGETLSCGTGAVAAAYACAQWYNMREQITFHFPGGELLVK